MQALFKHHLLTRTFSAYLKTVPPPVTGTHTPRQTLCPENACDPILTPPLSSKTLPSLCSASKADSSHRLSGIFKSDVAPEGMPLGMRPSHCHAVMHVQAFQPECMKSLHHQHGHHPLCPCPGPLLLGNSTGCHVHSSSVRLSPLAQMLQGCQCLKLEESPPCVHLSLSGDR